ncbi:MAG: hypothetical protein ACOCRO_08310 [Halanaerobiales bacterium]
MSKFYNYLNEDIDPYIKKIRQDCGYYLSLLDKNNIPTPFYRGVLNKQNFIHKKVRTGRIPKGTDIEAFKEINEYFEDKGHVRRDNSVIGTSHKKWAKFFGSPFMLFPVGKFDYSFVETTDFNSLKTYKKISQEARDFIKGEIPIYDDKIEKILAEIEGTITTNKNIKLAYENYLEIWFNCKEYYLLMAENGFSGFDEKNIMSRLRG